MSVPKSSRGRKLSPSKNSEQTIGAWHERIDYWKITRKAGNLFWKNKKRLIVVAVLLVLTGGQAITLNNFFSGNFNGGGSNITDNSKDSSNSSSSGNEDWRKTLDEIKNQEAFKNQIRTITEDKEKTFSFLALASAVVILIALIVFVLFSLNCYLHLLFIDTVQKINSCPGKNGEFKIIGQKEKNAIKKNVRGRWKQLAWMRVIFGLFYLVSLILFLFPAGFFALQESWGLAITLAGVAVLTLSVVFTIISYVFRYSLFYFILGKVGIRESVDRGYELFIKFWKESLLTSLVNFALRIIAFIAGALVLVICLVTFALLALFVGFIVYLLLGMAHTEGIAITVGIILVAIPLIITFLLLGAAWQGFVVIFWHLIFNEIAGCKLPEPAKETALVKEKKPAVKPVIQKEEE